MKNPQWSDCRLPKNLFKNDEKHFLFHLKSSFDIKSSYALFVLLIFRFLIFWFFYHIGKRLDKKAIVILKFMNSPIGKLTITTQILPNISRIKRNQAMKFRVLTKTRNDLKPPETIWNHPETIWNHLKTVILYYFLLKESYSQVPFVLLFHPKVFFGKFDL